MKKKLLAAAVVLTAVLMLGGCEGLSAKNAKGPETEESCLYITKMVTFSGSAWKRMKAAAIPKRNF